MSALIIIINIGKEVVRTEVAVVRCNGRCNLGVFIARLRLRPFVRWSLTKGFARGQVVTSQSRRASSLARVYGSGSANGAHLYEERTARSRYLIT